MIIASTGSSIAISTKVAGDLVIVGGAVRVLPSGIGQDGEGGRQDVGELHCCEAGKTKTTTRGEKRRGEWCRD